MDYLDQQLKTIKQIYKSPNVCKNGCAGAYYKTVTCNFIFSG